jgi:hypothetical protein
VKATGNNALGLLTVIVPVLLKVLGLPATLKLVIDPVYPVTVIHEALAGC